MKSFQLIKIATKASPAKKEAPIIDADFDFNPDDEPEDFGDFGLDDVIIGNQAPPKPAPNVADQWADFASPKPAPQEPSGPIDMEAEAEKWESFIQKTAGQYFPGDPEAENILATIIQANGGKIFAELAEATSGLFGENEALALLQACVSQGNVMFPAMLIAKILPNKDLITKDIFAETYKAVILGL